MSVLFPYLPTYEWILGKAGFYDNNPIYGFLREYDFICLDRNSIPNKGAKCSLGEFTVFQTLLPLCPFMHTYFRILICVSISNMCISQICSLHTSI